MRMQLQPGTVAWVQLDPTVGHGQSGTRPAVVVSSRGYLASVPELVIVVPATTTDRGWPHHIELTGSDLPRPTFAMTEQPRTISRARITGHAGTVDPHCLNDIRQWLADFLYE